MFCKNCGAKLGDQAVFCRECGASIHNASPSNTSASFNTQSLEHSNFKSRRELHWVPITLAVISFVLFSMGGDPDLNEVNVFDWLSALVGVIAFISTFFMIPQRRKVLRVVSIIITSFMALVTVFYLIPV